MQQTDFFDDLEKWSKQFPAALWNLGVVVISILIGYLIKLIITLLVRLYKDKTTYSLSRSVVEHLGRPLNYFVPLLTLNFTLSLMVLSKRVFNPLDKVFGILLIMSFASLLINSFKILEDYVYHQYDLNKDDNLKERKVRTQLLFVRKVFNAMVILIALAIVLLSFDNVRKIGAGLLTGVGIGGIIVGFAAQKSLSNFLAGFQIAFTQPIRIDDVLVVEGEWGRVEDITLTYVVLAIWDQRRLILPITYFIEKPFQNWTRTTSQILGTVFVYVDYTFPVDELRTELLRLLETTPLWDKRVGNLQVTDIKEHTIELRCLMSASNSSKAFDLRCFIREELLKYISVHIENRLPQVRYVISEFSRSGDNGPMPVPPPQLDKPKK